METKICTKCGEEKPLTEFNFKNKAKQKRQSQCKECQRARERELYNTSYREKNKDKYNKNRRCRREKMRDIINNTKRQGCAICRELDVCCLDFHHLRDKEFEVSTGTEVSLDRLLAEIDKCIILCANCHRKLHAGKIALRRGDQY